MGEEVLSGHVAESRHPVTSLGCGRLERTVGRHEVAIKEVVDTPNESIVDEGVGGLSGAEDTHGTGVLAIVGAAHPSLGEAVVAVVVFTCETVNGHDERQLAYVVHLCHV